MEPGWRVRWEGGAGRRRGDPEAQRAARGKEPSQNSFSLTSVKFDLVLLSSLDCTWIASGPDRSGSDSAPSLEEAPTLRTDCRILPAAFGCVVG